jgi:hypothetical protein
VLRAIISAAMVDLLVNFRISTTINYEETICHIIFRSHPVIQRFIKLTN